MSTERVKEITTELIDLCAQLHSIKERVLPLVEELTALSIKVSPEVQAMLLAMKPNKKAC